MVLPETPGGVIHALSVQKLLSCATGNKAQRFLNCKIIKPDHRHYPPDRIEAFNLIASLARFLECFK